ncbi:cysteine hydrolase family protein [Pseudonocardia sp. HH130630-07]|uniref:cysteine hydrolase family protein n=1 Tax=Pseudonocardia sp. HH130630-07 TaxID=1690815 RepID=UPI001E34A2F2|nr:isochorismatase family cysteine hydrolase [Pseudonocardia sp. HH130630-07]
MQNVFIDPSAPSAMTGADAVLDAVNTLVADAVDHDRPIFYTRDVDPTDLPPGDPDNQTGLHPDLDTRGTVIDKGPGKHGVYSGFVLNANDPDSGGPGRGGLNDLAEHLRATRVTHLTVVGLAADVCVAATARDARRLGYDVTIPLSATAFVHAHPDGDDAALADLTAAGITITD